MGGTTGGDDRPQPGTFLARGVVIRSQGWGSEDVAIPTREMGDDYDEHMDSDMWELVEVLGDGELKSIEFFDKEDEAVAARDLITRQSRPRWEDVSRHIYPDGWYESDRPVLVYLPSASPGGWYDTDRWVRIDCGEVPGRAHFNWEKYPESGDGEDAADRQISHWMPLPEPGDERWVEGVPGEGERVLVIYHDFILPQISTSDRISSGADILAWMPLPDPPDISDEYGDNARPDTGRDLARVGFYEGEDKEFVDAIGRALEDLREIAGRLVDPARDDYETGLRFTVQLGDLEAVGGTDAARGIRELSIFLDHHYPKSRYGEGGGEIGRLADRGRLTEIGRDIRTSCGGFSGRLPPVITAAAINSMSQGGHGTRLLATATRVDPIEAVYPPDGGTPAKTGNRMR